MRIAQAVRRASVNLISKYQSGRVDYLNAFWSVVNWEYVDQRLKSALADKVRLWPVTQKFSHSVRQRTERFEERGIIVITINGPWNH